MVWRLPVLLSKFFISLISFHHHFSSSFPAVLSFHILLLNTLPTQQLLITHVSFTYMPTEVCLNDYYLTPRNTPYLVIQIIVKIIFLFQLTRCEAYALTTFSNTSLVSSYKVLLCLKTSSPPQHYSHTFLFKITPTPLLSTPLFNNLNPVYLVCWSQHLLDTLTDSPYSNLQIPLFISLAACKHVFHNFIFLLSLANNSTVCRKSHFLIHIWFAKDCYVGRPF